MKERKLIEIPGDYLEGGGQIIRTSLAFSSITGIPFRVNNIRKSRPSPGLKNQHLYSIKTLKDICNATIDGADLGSEVVEFYPREIKGGNYEVNIKTAGSISLVLQAITIPLLFAQKNSKIKLIGGTSTKWSPPVEYFKEVFLPQLRRFADINLSILKRGYFPKGGGEVLIKIKPKFNISSYKDFNEFKKILANEVEIFELVGNTHIIKIEGISHASSDLMDSRVAERQADTAKILLSKYNCPIDISLNYSKTSCTGSGITLFAILSKNKDDIDYINPIRLGSDSLGEKGKKAEKVGEEAAKKLIEEIDSGALVDSYLADQILPLMALVGNSIIKTSKISNHTKTNIFIIEKFLGKKFDIDEEKNIISTI